MSPWMYAAPVVFVLVMVLVMMPIMKRKAAEATSAMSAMKDHKVLLFMLAGNLDSVNGVEASTLLQTNHIFAIDQDGPLSVAFTPNFVFHNTNYTGTAPMTVTFDAKAGHSYEITAENKEPADDASVIDVSPVVGGELIFKSQFFMVTKDVTDSPQAKSVRGVV